MTDDQPHDFGPRGGAFWQATLADYDLSDSELELLTETCRMLDEVELLHEAVEREGVTVLGSTGQPRSHPALTDLRQHRLAVGRLLSQLAIPGDDGSTLTTPTTARARTAANARWSAHRAQASG